MAEYEECIVFLLAKAYQRAHGIMKRTLQAHGLTPIQYLILGALWEEEGLTARQIGERLVLDGATLSGVLDRLAERGWILKETDTEDKRCLRVYLSDKARGLEAELREGRSEANEEILGNLTLEEKVLLKRFLKDLRE